MKELIDQLKEHLEALDAAENCGTADDEAFARGKIIDLIRENPSLWKFICWELP